MDLNQWWYPVLMSKQLKKDVLLNIRLFDESFVIFRDELGNPVCLENRCPHRGTPLSLGKVENGQLRCHYHGWRFGTEGQCKFIPSLPDIKQLTNKNAKNRACIEKFDAIWVLPDRNLSVHTVPFNDHLFPNNLEGELRYILSQWDVPVPHDLFMENLLDPAHLPFIHHNTLSRRSRAQKVTFEILEDQFAYVSGEINYHAYPNKWFREIAKFIEPCLIQHHFIHRKNHKEMISQFYCVPMTRDTTRVFSYTYPYNKFAYRIQKNKLIRFLGKPIEKLIAKQDVLVLRGQLENKIIGANLLNQPIASDVLVSKLRTWHSQHDMNEYWFNGY